MDALERGALVVTHDAVTKRDGYCRLQRLLRTATVLKIDVKAFGPCVGASELAHFGDWRRYRTRGKTPEKRHCTQGTLKLCRQHHLLYDAHKLTIRAQSDAYCDGPLMFETDGQVVLKEPI